MYSYIEFWMCKFGYEGHLKISNMTSTMVSAIADLKIESTPSALWTDLIYLSRIMWGMCRWIILESTVSLPSVIYIHSFWRERAHDMIPIPM